MPAAYSLDLRQKAIAAIDRGEKKSHVSKKLKISRNTLDLWLKRREATGSLVPKTPVKRGPDPKINDLVAFKAFATEHGRLTAQRMAELWPKPVSDVTLGKALKKIEFTRKKTYGYRERDEAKRQAFLQQIAGYKPAQIVFMDEAGVDNTHDYPYGYCHRSERFYDLKQGHRTERISMVSGWSVGKAFPEENREIVAPMTFKGYCNTLLIEAWVEQILAPELKPNQVVVMDNASFHKSSRIRELIEQAECELLFLPPYSPDFNKIEKFWARLKQHLGSRP